MVALENDPVGAAVGGGPRSHSRPKDAPCVAARGQDDARSVTPPATGHRRVVQRTTETDPRRVWERNEIQKERQDE
jgi:hypothetical protein